MASETKRQLLCTLNTGELRKDDQLYVLLVTKSGKVTRIKVKEGDDVQIVLEARKQPKLSHGQASEQH